ncbi:hypothetical protein K402DRAFT_166194 [Aulographum hederae CBS 113979]|uniref:Uncharacterized protein n=1 Tax=Aulographum hederae CBS 113979 TaxID=1176131 RepID=A0A6G1GR51_9PEZI|nr:hypothetical protein K402DRAFT_166194 [Aulographum hederae CBS 113979]
MASRPAEKDPWDWTVDDVVFAFCKSRALLLDGRPDRNLPEPVALEQTLRENAVDGEVLLTDVLEGNTMKEDLGLTSLGHRSSIRRVIEKLRQQSAKFLSRASPSAAGSVGVERQRSTASSLETFNSIPRRYATATTSPSVKEATPASSSKDAEGPVRKRAKLIHVEADGQPSSHTAKPPRPKARSGSRSGKAFLGENSLKIHSMFFNPENSGSESELDVEIPYTTSKEPPGKQIYAYKQISHLLSTDATIEAIDDGVQSISMQPYREKFIADGQPPPKIGVRLEAGKYQKIRTGPILMKDAVPNPAKSHEWDHLKHWASTTNDEDVLPAYGDSDGEESQLSELEMEMEEDRKEDEEVAARKNGQLSTTTMTKAIEEELEVRSQRWKEKVLPLRENNRAWSLWRKARSARRVFIERAKAKITHLEKRTDSLKAELMSQPWRNVSSLRRQCTSLDETVAQLEEQKWALSLFRRPEEPSRPKKLLRKVKKPSSVHASDEEGIALSDDSNEATDALDDFIDIDDVPLRPANHTQGNASAHQESNIQAGSLPDFEQHDDVDEALMEDTMDTDRRKKETVPLPSSPPLRKPTSFVDLTMSDDVDPPLTQSSRASRSRLSDQWREDRSTSEDIYSVPFGDASDEVVTAWKFKELATRADRKRFVVKLFRQQTTESYHAMARRLQMKKSHHRLLVDDIQRVLAATTKGVTQLAGMTAMQYEVAMKFAKLLACFDRLQREYWIRDIPWTVARDMLPPDEPSVEAIIQALQETVKKHPNPIPPIPRESRKKSVKEQPVKEQPVKKQPIKKQQVKKKSVKEQPVKEQLSKKLFETPKSRIVISSSEDEFPVRSAKGTPRKSKASKIRNADAMTKRFEAQARAQEDEDRRKKLGQSQEWPQEVSDGVIVNPGKSDDEGFIYLNARIGDHIQKHQIEGLQFMWREIVAATNEKADMAGCLLAHTMGLGKTMQAIALLLTIAEASVSPDETISSQVPESLRELKALVICPASLINNWQEEFYHWAPPWFFESVKRIDSDPKIKVPARLETLRDWAECGGVLIIGYPILRDMVSKPEYSEEIKTWLLNEPNIIVADEAHYLKNQESGIAKVAAKFKTKSRVALTGSPLSNNLLEYYQMIDWVAEGYLGPISEFREHYQRPIEDGLYKDSNVFDRRKGLKRQEVLIREIGPKVSRADITVLKGVLKPKVEFMITVELTDIQKDLYNAYIKSVSSGGAAENVTQTRLWQWIAVLSLLCNHPKAYHRKLCEEEKSLTLGSKASKKKKKNVAEGSGSLPERSTSGKSEEEASNTSLSPTHVPVPDIADETIKNLGFESSMIDEQKSILKSIEENMWSSVHSTKMRVFMEILKLSRQEGDRVLVFSHSIPTLDYLESVMDKHHISHARLDGRTKMSGRQSLAKGFNSGSIEVFLISTRAGGVGFNLQGANRIVIFDFSYNPTNEEQAIGRAYRIGQENPVYVYRFITGGTFEQVVFNKAVFKTQLAYNIVEQKKTLSMASKPTDFLFQVRDVKQHADLDNFMGKDPVLDQILADPESRGWIREISTTETLREEATDNLTAEELRDVEAMIADGKLRKENPEAWRAKHFPVYAPPVMPAVLPSAPQAQMLPNSSYSNGYPGATVPFSPSIQSMQQFIANNPSAMHQVMTSSPSTMQQILAHNPPLQQFAANNPSWMQQFIANNSSVNGPNSHLLSAHGNNYAIGNYALQRPTGIPRPFNPQQVRTNSTFHSSGPRIRSSDYATSRPSQVDGEADMLPATYKKRISAPPTLRTNTPPSDQTPPLGSEQPALEQTGSGAEEAWQTTNGLQNTASTGANGLPSAAMYTFDLPSTTDINGLPSPLEPDHGLPGQPGFDGPVQSDTSGLFEEAAKASGV